MKRAKFRRFNRTKTTVSMDGQKNWKKREDFLVCTITDSIKRSLFGSSAGLVTIQTMGYMYMNLHFNSPLSQINVKGIN